MEHFRVYIKLDEHLKALGGSLRELLLLVMKNPDKNFHTGIYGTQTARYRRKLAVMDNIVANLVRKWNEAISKSELSSVSEFDEKEIVNDPYVKLDETFGGKFLDILSDIENKRLPPQADHIVKKLREAAKVGTEFEYEYGCLADSLELRVRAST